MARLHCKQPSAGCWVRTPASQLLLNTLSVAHAVQLLEHGTDLLLRGAAASQVRLAPDGSEVTLRTQATSAEGLITSPYDPSVAIPLTVVTVGEVQALQRDDARLVVGRQTYVPLTLVLPQGKPCVERFLSKATVLTPSVCLLGSALGTGTESYAHGSVSIHPMAKGTCTIRAELNDSSLRVEKSYAVE